MDTPDTHLSPAEAAAKLGLSTKALKLYERHGLVTPIRAANGYRAYGPAEIARLHQVLALKRLGLPLSRIAGLVHGTLASLDAILALQQTVLGREAARISRALALIGTARARLAKGDHLSVDDLTNLTTETTMTTKVTQAELGAALKPMMEKHFTLSDRVQIGARAKDHPDAAGVWQELFVEAERVMASGDPASPEALDLARRWKAMVDAFTGGDPEMESKVTGVWSDAFADPATAARLPATREMFSFVNASIRLLKAQENR